ncbi:hypothetical protein [Marinovum sp.]|uniref:hypothetical protein n=1 Tax=Marinovum sp. TaxID=2024839 RepID=UPI003A8DF130
MQTPEHHDIPETPEAEAEAALAVLDEAWAYYSHEPLPARDAPAYTAPLAA